MNQTTSQKEPLRSDLVRVEPHIWERRNTSKIPPSEGSKALFKFNYTHSHPILSDPPLVEYYYISFNFVFFFCF